MPVQHCKRLRNTGLGLLILIGCVTSLLLLSGCASPQSESQDQPEVSDTPAQEATQPENPSKTLVAYFSATGNTEHIASMIAEDLGARLYAITPREAYSEKDLTDYYGENRPYAEYNDDKSRPELGCPLIEDINDYTTIYLGYPIWYGEAPKVIYSFLDLYSASGAVIYPFCTSGSSTITESLRELEAFYPEYTWEAGARFETDVSNETIKAWLESHNLEEA